MVAILGHTPTLVTSFCYYDSRPMLGHGKDCDTMAGNCYIIGVCVCVCICVSVCASSLFMSACVLT